jgi:hypothetical protein
MANIFIQNLPFLKNNAPAPDSQFRQACSEDIHRQHHLVDDPHQADLILFSKLSGYGPYLEIVLHPLFRKYQLKCYLFTSGDVPFYLLPGLFTSLEKKHHNPTWNRSCHYLHGPRNPYFRHERISETPKYLYTFIGSAANHLVRRRLIEMTSRRGFVRDTSLMRPVGEMEQKEKKDFRRFYADMIYAGSFVLCPRGCGTSSFRLFESMQCGRVPVILSDEWVAPRGPDWDKFAVRLRENQIDKLEEILGKIEPRAREMGCMARAAWERYFSPSESFQYVVEELLDLHRARSGTSGFSYREVVRLMSWLHLKGMLRTFVAYRR